MKGNLHEFEREWMQYLGVGCKDWPGYQSEDFIQGLREPIEQQCSGSVANVQPLPVPSLPLPSSWSRGCSW